MRPELEEALFEIEPAWFDRERGSMAFGFEHADGWHDLVKGLLENAAKRRADWTSAVDNPFAPPTFQVRQVKEKFGGLRFYYVGGDETFRADVVAAEARSFSICEECAAPGSVAATKRGRQQTLCKEHAEHTLTSPMPGVR